jgi:hypothetical protein
MTRDEKAALRAKAREERRRPREEHEEEAQHDAEPPEEPKQEEESQRDGRSRSRSEPQQAPKHGAPADELAEIASKARELLRSLRGVEAESVTGVTRTRNGWRVTLEVVELRRIPESTDVLASYEVQLDGDGGFLSFEQGRRYHRSQAEVGGGR